MRPANINTAHYADINHELRERICGAIAVLHGWFLDGCPPKKFILPRDEKTMQEWFGSNVANAVRKGMEPGPRKAALCARIAERTPKGYEGFWDDKDQAAAKKLAPVLSRLRDPKA